MAAGRRLQLAAVIAAFTAYSLLSHYSNSHPHAQNLGTALALAPMLTLGLALLWRFNGLAAVMPATLGVAILLYYCWPLFAQNFSMVYLLQQCGFYAIMSLSFARSLLKGRVPLCTQLADKVHGPLSELELRYTRQVTIAWVVFFLANLLATFLLFALAPLKVWSLFVHFFSLPLILLMFAAEFAVRRRVLPKVQRDGLMATLRVYFADPR